MPLYDNSTMDCMIDKMVRNLLSLLTDHWEFPQLQSSRMEHSDVDVTLRCLESRFEEKNRPNYQLLSAKRQLAINRRRPFLIMSSIACLLTFSDHSLKLRSEETVESLENPSFRAGKALLQMDLGKQLLSNLHFKVYSFKGNMQVSLSNTPVAG